MQKLYDRDELLADFRNYVTKRNPSKRYDCGEYEFKPLCEMNMRYFEANCKSLQELLNVGYWKQIYYPDFVVTTEVPKKKY